METQPIELRVPLDLRLVGVWLSELNGTNLSTLSPVSPRFTEEFTLRADGSADLRLPFSQSGNK